MRFREVFRYELTYRIRSASTWLYAGFLCFLAFAITHIAADSTAAVRTNAPARLAETSALFCGLFGLLVTAGLCADAAIRDRSARMEPLLFTTPLRPVEYLGGRFLAALITNCILAFAIPLGLAVAAAMPYLPREAFGPTRAAAYLQPLLLFVLPNVALTSAILFAIAARTRRAIPVYLGAVAIFIAYIVAANYWNAVTNSVLSALADPLGILAFKQMTQYWTVSERNAQLIGFPSMLLVNRVLWLAVAAALFAVLQRTYRFAERDESGGGATRVDVTGDAGRGVIVSRVNGVFGRRTRMSQMFAVMRQSLAEVMTGNAFRAGFVISIGLVMLWGWNVGETVYDTIVWPVTHLVAANVLSDRALPVIWLVIAMYAGELVWKDRETRASEIGDVVPIPTSVMLAGRFLALVAIIVFFELAFMAGGLLLQALHGYYSFELGLYVQILFGWNLIGYVIFAALAMTIHVLVNQKYVATLMTMIAIILLHAMAYEFHHLLIYNGGPGFTYSEMNGFGPFLETFLWFKLYWGAGALLLGVVMMLFWIRGPELGLRQRFATARERFTRRAASVTAIIVMLIAAVGGFIYYNTNILNEWVGRNRGGKSQAEYERRYSRYKELPQPAISAVNLRFELYPEKAALEARGTYQLSNQTGAPIPAIHVETPSGRGYEVRSMTFDRASKAEVTDQEHGYRIFALEKPLAPGDSMQMSFDVVSAQRGFAHYGNSTKIVANGTYFDRLLVPFIGYQPAFEISDEKTRKRFGLPPQPDTAPPSDVAARRSQFPVRNNGDRVNVETIVGTSLDQTAVVPGVLRRTWTENGRRYFHYGTREPESFGTAVFSATYAINEGRWRDVLLQVLHHPPHRYDVDRMLAAMRSALDFYSASFGPFPYRELRIVEVPPYSINGRAFPSAIAFAEQNFITRNDKGTVDLTFFGTAHETAHHWWGGQVRPAYAKGRTFVSETLANYSAMLVVEKVLGRTEAKRVYDFQMNRYLSRRGESGRDVPLLEVEDQSYISYGKGAVAMYTLREHIGDDAMNLALRRLLAKFGRSGPPYATSLDVYAELRAVTPPALQTMLNDLFATVTLWDVKTQRATTRRLPDGRYEVTIDVVAQKMRANETGVETPIPMNDLIELGVFAKDDEKPMYLARQSLHSGKQTIRVVVPREPSRAGVDPDHKLIEREREDNVVGVTR